MSPSGTGSSLTALEVASGVIFGTEELSPPQPEHTASPREALELAVLDALRRPPCVVTFSGGLDSSVVLAVAASVARREGLELPIAVTLRFPGRPEADESSWQEHVVAHVPVADWQRLDVGAELSVVGPVATDVLRTHGLLWPFNAYVHVPLFEVARGGSALTGFGGDELFLASRWDRLGALRARRERPRLTDLKRLGLAFLPAPVRAGVLRRGEGGPRLDWLRPDAQDELTRAWARSEACAPIGRRSRGLWRLGLRPLRTAGRSLAMLAESRDVALVHPFTDARVVAAFADDGIDSTAGRGERLRAAIGDLLPSALYGRSTKAGFNTALWAGDARSLAADWSGEGVDLSLVDPHVVASHWASDVPDGRTFTMLQAAWLTRATGGATHAGRLPTPPTTPVPKAE